MFGSAKGIPRNSVTHSEDHPKQSRKLQRDTAGVHIEVASEAAER